MFLDRKIIDSNKTFLPDIVNDLNMRFKVVKKILFIVGCSAGMVVFQVPVYASDTSVTQAANLLTKIQVEGHMNVIVNLDVTIPAHISSLTGIEHDQALMAVMADVQDSLLQRMDDAGVEISNIMKFPYTPQISMTVTEEALLALKADNLVDQIVENGSLDGDLGQSVPKIFPSVSTSNFSGSGYTVAVLDTGVDTNHFAFDGKVVAEACFSGSGDAVLSFCPNGEAEQIGSGAGINFDCDLEITKGTGCDHGTHVAGIAVGGNIPGPAPDFGMIHGVAKQANLIPIQVFSKRELSDGSIGNTALFADIAMALSHVYSLRNNPSVGEIAAVNMSLGGNGPFNTMDECNESSGSMALRPMIKMLKEANIATVVASGNGNFETGIEVPACIVEAIAVGATDNNDEKYNFCGSPDDTNCGSSSGDLLDLWAPGVHIFSASAESDFGLGVTRKSGTSMAAPHVAGAWAVMKQNKPAATVDEIENAFKSTGKPITIAGVTRKRIDIDEALDALSGSDSGVLTPLAPSGSITDNTPTFTWTEIPGTIRYAVVARDSAGNYLVNNSTGTITCPGGICSYTKSNTIFPDGVYSWNVRVINPDNSNGIESSVLNFTVGIEDTTPIPTGIIDACQQGQTPVGNVELTPDNAVCLQDVANGNQRQMHFHVPDDKVGSTLEIILSHGTGNGNLLHRHGNRPTRTIYDHISDNSGNEERILVENVQRSWNYIHVRADTTFSGVTLLVRYQ
jgi:subtilisin family serine protease